MKCPEPVIRELIIRNFKSLREPAPIKLRPITLLLGPNSSGKTALIQTIILLKQTAESRNILTPIVVRGRYADLGSYKDMIFRHDINRNLEIGIKLNTQRLRPSPILLIPPRISRHVYEKARRMLRTSNFCFLKFTIGLDPLRERIVNKGIEFSIGEQAYLKISDSHLIGEFDNMPFDIELDNNIVASFKTTNVLFVTDPFWPPIARSRIERYRNEAMLIMLSLLRGSLFQLQRLLIDKTYYIGPLREYPHRYYIASGEYPRDVGLRGEYTVEVIYSDFKRREQLYEKLKFWMRKMDIAKDMRLKSIAEGIYALTILDPKQKIEINITDIGFGASQLLPIIVEGIYARPGSILLIEQPEIHLHPKLQAILADFLIEVAKEGKQIIIETHSEHILLRLRRRIAEEKITNKDVAIYYFELAEHGTEITNISVDEYGTLESLPKGFFEEDIIDTYELLMAAARRKGYET